MVAAHQAAAVAVAAHADVKVSNLPLFTAPESVVKRFSIDGIGMGENEVGIRVVKPNLKKQSNKQTQSSIRPYNRKRGHNRVQL